MYILCNLLCISMFVINKIRLEECQLKTLQF